MYLINITLNMNEIPADRAEAMFAEHRAWFVRYFDAGKFLVLGPYLDAQHAGVIIAKTDSRAELDDILAADVYWQNGADYEIREFKAAMAADVSVHQGE
ncbi:hypothetical protein BG910_01800 [Neisseria chenwenguii]|uniref:YCII-related domain-containing protein n=1 Tax=Neisseria chenwenguii TaxID=1853278 RepID=A0A220RZP9_9NEIS|nr:YciI family protein [Neisseria chenwenguii]ASK26643.1 hypothetical protein BG910_01800 [Neisseria chenwenguii]